MTYSLDTTEASMGAAAVATACACVRMIDIRKAFSAACAETDEMLIMFSLPASHKRNHLESWNFFSCACTPTPVAWLARRGSLPTNDEWYGQCAQVHTARACLTCHVNVS